MVAGTDGQLVILGVGPAAGMHHIAYVGPETGYPQGHAGSLRGCAPEEVAEVDVVVRDSAFLFRPGDIITPG